MICFSPFAPAFYTAESYMVSAVMFWTALCDSLYAGSTGSHKDASVRDANVCTMRNYCSFFGQVCSECRHVKITFDEELED